MIVNVDYTKVIEELADQIKALTMNNAILKAQLSAVSSELDNLINNQNEPVAQNGYEYDYESNLETMTTEIGEYHEEGERFNE